MALGATIPAAAKSTEIKDYSPAFERHQRPGGYTLRDHRVPARGEEHFVPKVTSRETWEIQFVRAFPIDVERLIFLLEKRLKALILEMNPDLQVIGTKEHEALIGSGGLSIHPYAPRGTGSIYIEMEVRGYYDKPEGRLFFNVTVDSEPVQVPVVNKAKPLVEGALLKLFDELESMSVVRFRDFLDSGKALEKADVKVGDTADLLMWDGHRIPSARILELGQEKVVVLDHLDERQELSLLDIRLAEKLEM